MMVDASAIVAMMVGEAGFEILAFRLDAAAHNSTHAISLFEAVTAISRIKAFDLTRAQREVDEFVHRAELQIVDIGPAEGAAAIDAFSRYGKGRHPAGLNMGDCFSYACAKTRGLPLLYKGKDFAKTDLA